MSTQVETTPGGANVKESRIGKQFVVVPAGVTVTIGETEIEVKGPKGRLVSPLPAGVTAEQDGDRGIRFRAAGAQQRALHGLARALTASAVKGVTDGFTREMDIVGVGYKADLKGRMLTLTLGYSHLIYFIPPDGVDIKIEKKQRQINQYQTTLIVSGIDKQVVGQVCANLHSLRRPDAYKGKGVRYADVQLRLKPGKSAK